MEALEESQEDVDSASKAAGKRIEALGKELDGAQKSANELHLVDIGCLKELDERGVLCAIMTDGPARKPWMILAQAGEAVRFGCDPQRALRMITINAARILGCEDRIGSIEEGKDADLVLFDRHPLISTAARTRMTMIDGEIVYCR